MKTWTGTDAPLTDANPEPNIIDLVIHSGRTRRWGGFGDPNYTVLHHEMLTALIWLKAGFPPEGVCHPLNHDKHENYSGDIPSPVKALMGPGANALEKALDARIFRSLNMPPMTSLEARRVKICDLVALCIEAPLFGPPGAGAPCEHSATVNNLPEEFREEVAAALKKVLPDFDRIVATRRAHGQG